MTGCSDYLDSDYLFEERMSIEDVFAATKDHTNQLVGGRLCLI